MKKSLFLLIMTAMLALAAGPASAAGYAQGTFTIAATGGAYGALGSNATSSFFTYGLDLGWFVVDGLELGARGQGIYLNTKFTNPVSGNDLWDHFNGGGLEGFARWHFYRFNNDMGSIFATIGAGALWMADSNRFALETGLNNGANFTGTAGLGVSYAFAPYFNVQLAGSYRHIGGFDKNTIDGLGGTLSLQFTF